MSTNLLDRIKNSLNELTKSERKIATAILANPQFVVSENIADLAKRCQVSQPSVFRFCKRFGTKGFPDFKFVLSSCCSFKPYTERTEETLPLSVKLHNLILSNQSLIASFNSLTQNEKFYALLSDLYSCRRLVIFCDPSKYSLAKILKNGFLQFSKPSDICLSEQEFLISSTLLSPQDFVILFFKSLSPSLIPLLATLSKQGQNIINFSVETDSDLSFFSHFVNLSENANISNLNLSELYFTAFLLQSLDLFSKK